MRISIEAKINPAPETSSTIPVDQADIQERLSMRARLANIFGNGNPVKQDFAGVDPGSKFNYETRIYEPEE